MERYYGQLSMTFAQAADKGSAQYGDHNCDQQEHSQEIDTTLFYFQNAIRTDSDLITITFRHKIVSKRTDRHSETMVSSNGGFLIVDMYFDRRQKQQCRDHIDDQHFDGSLFLVNSHISAF